VDGRHRATLPACEDCRLARTSGTARGMLRFVRRLRGGQKMSIIAWIVLGLIAGFIASKIVNRQGEGLLLNMALGIIGALVGGFLFSAVGQTGITGFNIYSIFVAIIGAIVVLLIYQALTGRRGIR
jgi:uncharacterized membrane protein YeaQ/YmgE (transglycosylase-associated protein family)